MVTNCIGALVLKDKVHNKVVCDFLETIGRDGAFVVMLVLAIHGNPVANEFAREMWILFLKQKSALQNTEQSKKET